MKHVIRWAPPIAMMMIIFTLSSRTGAQIDTLLPFFQKLLPSLQSFDAGHFLEYFILSLTFLWAVSGAKPSWKAKVLSIALSAVYGATDEFHQLYVPGRMCDIYDLRNDTVGAALAMLVLTIPPVARWYAKLPHAKKN